MSPRKTLALFAAAFLVFAGVGAAGHNSDHDEGPSDASTWGRCTAYENNDTGRENGEAGNASAFQDLEDDAGDNETVSEHCDDAEHPSESHPPEDAGPPENASDEGSSGNETEAQDDRGPPEDRGNSDEAGPPEDRGRD